MKWEEVRGTAAGTPERVREETEKYPELSREKQIERKKEREYDAQTKTRQKTHQSNPKENKQPPFEDAVGFKENEFSYDTLFSRRTDSSIIARRRHIGSLPAAAEFVEPVGRETNPPRPSSPPSLLTLASI